MPPASVCHNTTNLKNSIHISCGEGEIRSLLSLACPVFRLDAILCLFTLALLVSVDKPAKVEVPGNPQQRLIDMGFEEAHNYLCYLLLAPQPMLPEKKTPELSRCPFFPEE